MRICRRVLICLTLVLCVLASACAVQTPPVATPTATAQATPEPTPAPTEEAPTPQPEDGEDIGGDEAVDTFQDADALQQSYDPFTMSDIWFLIPEGATIGDVAEMIDAQTVSWLYEGEATGESHLVLHNGNNFIKLAFIAPEGSVMEESDGADEPTDIIPPELLEEEAIITGAGWLDNGFAVPFIRGVAVGADESDVLRAFLCLDAQGESIYGIDVLNPLADESWASGFVGARHYVYDNEYYDVPMQVIEYVWSDVSEEDEWRIYYTLTYEMEDAKVAAIYLSYGTDPE